ncbi:MAG: iron-containing alcohol dehydrogenase, partial [Clostridiales bacterium]|nr:iron-containing alcohol dehydrogenase [Clostridiales bacterium]
MIDIRENTKKITNIAHASFPIRKFVAPEIILGDGSRSLISQYVLSLAGRDIFLVTDPGVIKAGWAGEVADNLTSTGLDVVIYDKVSSNPRS